MAQQRPQSGSGAGRAPRARAYLTAWKKTRRWAGRVARQLWRHRGLYRLRYALRFHQRGMPFSTGLADFDGAGFEHFCDGYELDPAGAADEAISYYGDGA